MEHRPAWPSVGSSNGCRYDAKGIAVTSLVSTAVGMHFGDVAVRRRRENCLQDRRRRPGHQTRTLVIQRWPEGENHPRTPNRRTTVAATSIGSPDCASTLPLGQRGREESDLPELPFAKKFDAVRIALPPWKSFGPGRTATAFASAQVARGSPDVRVRTSRRKTTKKAGNFGVAQHCAALSEAGHGRAKYVIGG